LENIGNVDSKYRFVILAAKRAKQLLRGVKPKIKAKSKNLIRIAQTEVRSGLIEYEILPTQLDELLNREDQAFVGDELAAGSAESDDVSAKAEEDESGEEDEEEDGEEDGEEEGEEEGEKESDEDDSDNS
jgi:DNA-directed RNA polymerase omega subunit